VTVGEAARVELAERGGEPFPPVEQYHDVRQPVFRPDRGPLLGEVREPAFREQFLAPAELAVQPPSSRTARSVWVPG
jgi:hypothetical protein